MGNKLDVVLDGGPCRVGVESTIVGFPKGVVTVYRKGGLPIEEIEVALGRKVSVRPHGDSRPAAPGMLSKHYSPGVALELVDRIDTHDPPGRYDAAVVFGRGRANTWRSPGSNLTVYDLSPRGDLAEAARRLFAVLRQLNAGAYVRVAVTQVPEEGIGRAINDRLRRAAAT